MTDEEFEFPDLSGFAIDADIGATQASANEVRICWTQYFAALDASAPDLSNAGVAVQAQNL